MNLDEIRKRAEFIRPDDGYENQLHFNCNSDLKWAADTILELCAEIERMGKSHVEFGQMMFNDLEKSETALNKTRELLGEFIEVHDEECWYDHHGYCQAHFVEDDCLIKRTKAALSEECMK